MGKQFISHLQELINEMYEINNALIVRLLKIKEKIKLIYWIADFSINKIFLIKIIIKTKENIILLAINNVNKK